jgi:hypothetical protein
MRRKSGGVNKFMRDEIVSEPTWICGNLFQQFQRGSENVSHRTSPRTQAGQTDAGNPKAAEPSGGKWIPCLRKTRKQ